jgi:hypothetical protein
MFNKILISLITLTLAVSFTSCNKRRKLFVCSTYLNGFEYSRQFFLTCDSCKAAPGFNTTCEKEIK